MTMSSDDLLYYLWLVWTAALLSGMLALYFGYV
jgi:hypothetical protein